MANAYANLPYGAVKSKDGLHTTWYSYAIAVDGNTIGSFARFGASSTRTVERIRHILQSDGPAVIDMVWGGTDTKITIEYVQLFQKNIFEQMGFNVYSLEDLTFAFDIVEVCTPPAGSDLPTHTVTYEACVASEWGKDLDSGGTKVIETLGVEVSRVFGSTG